MNKIEITVLSARVLDALSGRGLKAKTVHEFERYGTRRIVKHCLGKGQILYSKETVQNFVWQERAKQESGTLPHYQWGITRRAAVYLDQMAEYGKIQDEPIRPWEAEHNPLFQAISRNPSNSMKVIDIICRTRDAVMQLELSDKTKTNYIYCGFGAILNFFISRGEESYSPETLALFEKTVQENFVNGAMQKASFQTMRKAAHWIEEYLSTGQVSQQKLRKYNFACAPPEFENLLSQYQLYMDNDASVWPELLRLRDLNLGFTISDILLQRNVSVVGCEKAVILMQCCRFSPHTWDTPVMKIRFTMSTWFLIFMSVLEQ